MVAAEIILWTALVYAVLGLTVGVSFVRRGVDQMDASAKDASLAFRLLILPGCVALWPWVVKRWITAGKGVGHS